MARADVTEGKALWQPGGAEEDSCFPAGDWHLYLVYNKKVEDALQPKSQKCSEAPASHLITNILANEAEMGRPHHLIEARQLG